METQGKHLEEMGLKHSDAVWYSRWFKLDLITHLCSSLLLPTEFASCSSKGTLQILLTSTSMDNSRYTKRSIRSRTNGTAHWKLRRRRRKFDCCTTTEFHAFSDRASIIRQSKQSTARNLRFGKILPLLDVLEIFLVHVRWYVWLAVGVLRALVKWYMLYCTRY